MPCCAYSTAGLAHFENKRSEWLRRTSSSSSSSMVISEGGSAGLGLDSSRRLASAARTPTQVMYCTVCVSTVLYACLLYCIIPQLYLILYL